MSQKNIDLKKEVQRRALNEIVQQEVPFMQKIKFIGVIERIIKECDSSNLLPLKIYEELRFSGDLQEKTITEKGSSKSVTYVWTPCSYEPLLLHTNRAGEKIYKEMLDPLSPLAHMFYWGVFGTEEDEISIMRQESPYMREEDIFASEHATEVFLTLEGVLNALREMDAQMLLWKEN